MCTSIAQTFDWVQNTLVHQRLELRVPLGIKAVQSQKFSKTDQLFQNPYRAINGIDSRCKIRLCSLSGEY